MDTTKQNASQRVVNGTWYEVCVSVKNEIRDVIIESSKQDAVRCADHLATRWPDCDTIFIRQHRKDPKRGDGASTFRVLHKLTLDFRKGAN